MAKNEPSGRGRTRNFACVVYPESAPEFWQGILAEQCVPAFISPLHDKDINPGGEPKKEHYHVMIMFEGVKSIEQAKEVFDKIGGVGCEKINSIRGYARYLTHADNPEKFQYSVNDVVALGGADYFKATSLDSDRYKSIQEMMEFIRENNIIAFSELADYAAANNPTWFRLLCDNSTLYIKEYIKSRVWLQDKIKHEVQRPR